ncbi:hypothetical protein D3C73_1626420 [compost metagenome]
MLVAAAVPVVPALPVAAVLAAAAAAAALATSVDVLAADSASLDCGLLQAPPR